MKAKKSSREKVLHDLKTMCVVDEIMAICAAINNGDEARLAKIKKSIETPGSDEELAEANAVINKVMAAHGYC